MRISEELSREHGEFTEIVSNSGLSTLSDFINVEEKEYGCVKYMVCSSTCTSN